MIIHSCMMVIIIIGSWTSVAVMADCGDAALYTVRTIRVSSTSSPAITSTTNTIECYKTCRESGLAEPAAFQYNAAAEECSCYSASEYKMMRVYPTDHMSINDTIPTADFYLASSNVYTCRQIHEGVVWETVSVYAQDPLLVTDDFAHMLACDGTWTLFLRRISNAVDFNRTWDDYVKGFGNIHRNFWLGLESIHQGSAVLGNNVLEIYLESFTEGDTASAQYTTFSLAGADTNYRLSNGGYTGTAGHSLASTIEMPFSTTDRDNDIHDTTHCAQLYQGGWWQSNCHRGMLTGPYCASADAVTSSLGLMWNEYKGPATCLKTAIMAFQ